MAPLEYSGFLKCWYRRQGGEKKCHARKMLQQQGCLGLKTHWPGAYDVLVRWGGDGIRLVFQFHYEDWTVLPTICHLIPLSIDEVVFELE
jgi:hypothetical protein